MLFPSLFHKFQFTPLDQNKGFKNLKFFLILDEVQLYGDGKEREIRLRNVMSHTEPLIVHGNGPSKIRLNYLGNYISKAWSPDRNCKHCTYGLINLTNIQDTNKPIVFIALFIEQATPFFEEHLWKVHELIYPRDRIHLFVHNSVSIYIYIYLFYNP